MFARDGAARELLDAETLDEATLRRNLADIRRINLLLGWRTFTVRAVARTVRSLGLGAFTLLDVACGSADMPLAIARWARRAGIDAHIVACDISPQIVAIAGGEVTREPTVSVEVQDALALPYPSGSYDIALCTLSLHHFDPATAVTLLRNMARVGRHVLLFDIERSRLAYLGAVALTNALAMHPMTRHDAPASVRRAYSVAELRELAARARLRGARITARFPFRLALEADRN
jgi:2-polyprenyl-3-methyl-5-hydroxy-6-metoxy-1,4-benzoquinol methylase